MNQEKSCGAIIHYKGKYLLIHQVNGLWGFPKGHVERNETEEQTALREIKEETNLDVKIDSNFRKSISYYIESHDAMKKAVYFIAEAINTNVIIQNSEIIEYKWLTSEDALELISKDNIKKIFQEAIKYLKN